MNRIILYIVVLVLLFSTLHYMASTNVSLTQLDLTVPMKNSQQHVIINPNTVSRGGNEIYLNVKNTSSSQSISRGGGNSINEENWLHKILGVILGILSAVSMLIKFLIDLTIIRIPQPSINETSVNENQIVVNPLHTLMVILLSATLTVVLLYLSNSNIRLRKHAHRLPTKHRIRLEPSGVIGHSLDFSDIRSAITSSFQHLYHLAHEKLGLDEARTPREIALEFEEIDLGDEAWLIVSAYEELKYGGRVPGWLTLKDLREAVGIIDGKIMKWSNR